MTDNRDLLQEAVMYFKERPGLHRLLVQVKQKYQSLNAMGGTAKITKLTSIEKEHLGFFFNRKLTHQESFSVQINSIENLLLMTRFAGVGLKDILESYFGEKILGNKVIEQNYLQLRQQKIEQWLEKQTPNQIKVWFTEQLAVDTSLRRTIFQKYRDNPQNCFQQLDILIKALNRIQIEQFRSKKIAQFAAEVSGNPHYLDVGTEGEKLLSQALNRLSDTQVKITTAESRGEVYFKFGLIRDTISNFTFCYQLEAFDLDGKSHLGIEGYNRMDEAQIVTLETISQLSRVTCHKQRVYVCENPTVFHNLITERSGKQAISLMCTNGQLTVASLLMLDLLVKSGASIYYSGDFDPEGLQIAARLKLRYGSQLEFWRFSESDYYASLSSEVIDARRLRKLNGLSDASLQSIAALIDKEGRAGYQETIFERYLEDVEREFM